MNESALTSDFLGRFQAISRLSHIYMDHKLSYTGFYRGRKNEVGFISHRLKLCGICTLQGHLTRILISLHIYQPGRRAIVHARTQGVDHASLSGGIHIALVVLL